MLGLALVRPLEEPWREALDAVARSHRWPTSREVARLAARVSELSAAYNDPRRARALVREAGAARLGFSFPRDVPKGAGAVRELLAVGALPLDGPLRVLDIGAGLGAMTWGLARARARAGGTGGIEATWVDADGEALDVGLALADEAARASLLPGTVLQAKPLRISLDAQARAAGDAVSGAVGSHATFDVILLGHVLSELDTGADPDARAAQHAAWLNALVGRHLAPQGSLVVVEPALRDRTRHLHRVRDAAVREGAGLFAPCLHAAPCPALAAEGDWCHEDLRVDLPAWLVPVAKAAGLRYEGLTYSYLVLRKDAVTLAGAAGAPAGAGRLRVVSDRMKSKGKLEMYLCGSLGRGEEGDPPGSLVPDRVRATLLDRHLVADNRIWQRLERGEVVFVSPPPAVDDGRGAGVAAAGAPAARVRLDASTRLSLPDESR